MYCVGRRINHKLFGSGLIVLQTDCNIVVRFDTKQNELCFTFPNDNYQKYFEFDFEYDRKRNEVLKILLDYIIECPKYVFKRSELILFSISHFYDEKKETIVELVRGLFDELTIVLNTKYSGKYEKKGKLIFNSEKESNFMKFTDNESLINNLSYYIIYNNITNVSKNALLNITKKGYSDNKKREISNELIKKIVLNLNDLSGNTFCRRKDNILLASSSSSKEIRCSDFPIIENFTEIDYLDTINLICDSIIENNYDSINISMLLSFFKKNSILKTIVNLDISSNRILDDVFNELNFKNKGKYLLVENTIYRANLKENGKTFNSIESEYSSFIANYLLQNKFDKIKSNRIELYAYKHFFEKKNVKPIKMTYSIIFDALSIISKTGIFGYEYKNNFFIKKTNPSISNRVTNVEKKQIAEIPNMEKISDSIELISMIKSVILLQNKKDFSIEQLNEEIRKRYKKEPGTLISEDLLISLCIELFTKQKGFYYLTKENNTLLLKKTSSFQEWQLYAIGSIYNPSVNVNNKKYDLNDFTLYVYDSLNSINCSKIANHQIEDVTINTITIAGYSVSFNAYYCAKCNKYFTTKNAIDKIFPEKNYPFVKLRLANSQPVELQSETILHMYGYNVKAGGPTEIQRENLLSKLLTYGIVTKKEVEGLLWHLIHYNGKKKNMENAKEKWENDLAFVQDFNLNKQKQLYINRIKHFK